MEHATTWRWATGRAATASTTASASTDTAGTDGAGPNRNSAANWALRCLPPLAARLSATRRTHRSGTS